jgi:hypothetical protein
MRTAIVIPPDCKAGGELHYSLPDKGCDYAVIMRPVAADGSPLPFPWVRAGTFTTRASARRSIARGGIRSYLARWHHRHPGTPGVQFVILPVRWEGVPFVYCHRTDDEFRTVWF